MIFQMAQDSSIRVTAKVASIRSFCANCDVVAKENAFTSAFSLAVLASLSHWGLAQQSFRWHHRWYCLELSANRISPWVGSRTWVRRKPLPIVESRNEAYSCNPACCRRGWCPTLQACCQIRFLLSWCVVVRLGFHSSSLTTREPPRPSLASRCRSLSGHRCRWRRTMAMVFLRLRVAWCWVRFESLQSRCFEVVPSKENPPINGHYDSVGIELERERQWQKYF